MDDKRPLAERLADATRKPVPFWTPRRVWDSEKGAFVEVPPEFIPTDRRLFGSNAKAVLIQGAIILLVGYAALKLIQLF